MKTRTRAVAATGLTAIVMLSLVPADPGAPAWAAPGAMVTAVAQPEVRTVTLVTGDRVTVLPGGEAVIRRHPRRPDSRFRIERAGGHLSVLPVDAIPLLNSGALDARLFDVTLLLESGYDDRQAELPVVIAYTDQAPARPVPPGARAGHDLPTLGARAVRVAKRQSDAFFTGITTADRRELAAGLRQVWLDGLRRPALDVSVPQIGAPAAWQAGFDGTGVTVAVLDTGIDADHPDLAGRIRARANFTGVADDRDLVGHGTHVASTVAGSGAASGGRYRGVAPGARLLDGKVCPDRSCSESAILAGMQWAARQGADVVNLSLGGPDTPGVDPLESAVNTLTKKYGALFVIAAGNEGEDGSVGSPSTADAAVSVGAVSKADELAEFSSRGPRAGDAAVKPDITAPGVEITAARGKDGEFGEPGEPYTTASGTSMATPHVAGAAAILAQRRPDWSPAQLKAALMASAQPNPAAGPYAQGSGRVRVAEAIAQEVVTDPPSVSFGRQLWPHHDDTPAVKTVTYRNTGAADVTLDLEVAPSAGTPAGMFTVGASRVTVPAGGQTQVSVTADTRVGAVDGFLGARLVATAPGTAVQTPVAVEREIESYDLTLVHSGRDGKRTDSYRTGLLRVDRFASYVPYDRDGTVTIRVPRGLYHLNSNVYDSARDPADPRQRRLLISNLVQPLLEVTASQTIALDASRAAPVRVSIPRADATPVLAMLETSLSTPEVLVLAGILTDRLDTLYSGPVGPDQPVPNFLSKVHGVWARVGGDGGALDSPYTYSAAYFAEGRMLHGVDRRLTDDDFAVVQARHAAQEPGSVGGKGAFPFPPGDPVNVSTIILPMRLPSTRTEYYNTDEGVRWAPFIIESTADESGVALDDIGGATAPPTSYTAGTITAEDWNRAVFGPGFTRPTWRADFVNRTGDTIHVRPPMYSDAAGREGFARGDKGGRTALYRDGELVGELGGLGGRFTVAPDAARYRLEVGAQRTLGTLSTVVSGVWTFDSAHVAGDTPQRLPLWTVGFAPPVDDLQTAPAGREFRVPVTVAGQPGSPVGALRTVAVEVSYDDGDTWRPAKVTTTATGERHVVLRHPDRDGYVSLRAMAADEQGNAVLQTILHAYRIVHGEGN